MGTHPIFESDFDCLTDFFSLKYFCRIMVKANRKRKSNTETAASPRRARSSNVAVIVEIVQKKQIGGQPHFLCKWSEAKKKDSWEPSTEVKKLAAGLLKDFNKAQAADEEPAEYVVEAIIDKKSTKGNVKYMVKWEGYSSRENTWEEADSLPANQIK